MDKLNECNVLGNGPSRVSFIDNGLPSIGCNIPWTPVDHTIIFGNDIIDLIHQTPDLIPSTTKIVVADLTLKYINTTHVDLLPRIHAVYKYVRTKDLRTSVGHIAVQYMIQQGFKVINVYGCDNYFGDLKCFESYTRNWKLTTDNLIKAHTDSEMELRGHQWRSTWEYIIRSNPSVQINFIP